MSGHRGPHGAGAAAGDGRPLGADDRALRRELRDRDRLYAAAWDAGVAGAAWEPALWPDDPAVRDAYDAGVSERRRRRREGAGVVAVAVLRWAARHAAPRTARRLRRAGRRWRRVRRVVEGVRS